MPSSAPTSPINYREQDFVEVVREATDGHGADVVLDNMGAKYLGRNVDVLATEGRLVIIGMQGGTKAELDIGVLLRKRGAVIATALRVAGRSRRSPRSAARWSSTCGRWWPRARCGPIVHTTLPLAEAAEAHALMESSGNVGNRIRRALGGAGGDQRERDRLSAATSMS